MSLRALPLRNTCTLPKHPLYKRPGVKAFTWKKFELQIVARKTPAVWVLAEVQTDDARGLRDLIIA